MFRALARAAILMAIAPPAPVSWSPGARTLPESVLSRLPSGAARAVDRFDVTRLRPSRTRVIALPVEGGPGTPRTAGLAPAVAMTAPWGEPRSPFAGVTVTTSWVPREWLRPSAPDGTLIPLPVARPIAAPDAPASAPRDAVASRQATTTTLPRSARVWPPTPAVSSTKRPHGRFRRAAALAIGLLVSLVAVEAAARSGRR